MGGEHLHAQPTRNSVVVAVTGHRRLPDPAAVAADVKAALARIVDRRGNPMADLIVVSLLAPGADTIAAEAALEAGGSVIAILPLSLEQYALRFSPEDSARMAELLGLCDEILLPTEILAEPECYRRAGERMLGIAEELLAVWDGLPSRGRGGTAEIVKLAQEMRIPVTRVRF